MTFLLTKTLPVLTLAALLLQPALAQSGASAAPRPVSIRAVATPAATYYLEGERLIATTSKTGYAVYLYQQGRLAKIAHSDGRWTRYHYQEGRLDRIEFSDGTVHTAVYRAGALASLGSSSGQTLGLVPGVEGADKVVLQQPPGAAGAAPSPQKRAGTAARALDANALNKKLIAIERWEADDWECSLNPDGEQTCIGRADPGEGGFADPPWFPDLPIEPIPGEDESGNRGRATPRPIAPDQPTLESCIQAAYNTWVVMRDAICPMVANQQRCLQANYRLFQELREECKVMYP